MSQIATVKTERPASKRGTKLHLKLVEADKKAVGATTTPTIEVPKPDRLVLSEEERAIPLRERPIRPLNRAEVEYLVGDCIYFMARRLRLQEPLEKHVTGTSNMEWLRKAFQGRAPHQEEFEKFVNFCDRRGLTFEMKERAETDRVKAYVALVCHRPKKLTKAALVPTT